MYCSSFGGSSVLSLLLLLMLPTQFLVLWVVLLLARDIVIPRLVASRTGFQWNEIAFIIVAGFIGAPSPGWKATAITHFGWW